VGAQGGCGSTDSKDVRVEIRRLWEHKVWEHDMSQEVGKGVWEHKEIT